MPWFAKYNAHVNIIHAQNTILSWTPGAVLKQDFILFSSTSNTSVRKLLKRNMYWKKCDIYWINKSTEDLSLQYPATQVVRSPQYKDGLRINKLSKKACIWGVVHPYKIHKLTAHTWSEKHRRYPFHDICMCVYVLYICGLYLRWRSITCGWTWQCRRPSTRPASTTSSIPTSYSMKNVYMRYVR